MSAGVDLSVRTLYDQIWAYTHFINEAPALSESIIRAVQWGMWIMAVKKKYHNS